MLSAGHCYDQFQINADIRVSQVRAYLPDYKVYLIIHLIKGIKKPNA